MADAAGICGRLSAAIVGCLVASETAVRNYGQQTCFGRSVLGSAGNTYHLAMVILIVSAMTLGAVGAMRGSKLGFVGLSSFLIILLPV